MIELRHLRYFVAVAEELNFTRAAQRLHTAQPSLSQQIRSLESYLGTPLLDRSNRKVVLTAAGERFLAEARLALQQTEKAVALVRAVAEPDRLRIGFDPGLAIDLIPRLLPRISKALPGVTCDIRSLPPCDLYQALRDEAVDAVFTGFADGDNRIVAEKLYEESLIAVIPANYVRLRSLDTISLQALQNVPVILPETAICPHLCQSLTQRCEELGVTLSVAREVHNLFEALALALGGCGVVLCSSGLARLIPSNLVIRQFDTAAPRLNIAVAHRAGNVSKKLRKLLQIAREVGPDMAPSPRAMSGAA